MNDDIAVCPTCGDEFPATDLCEHDDPDSGPLCIGRCCEWHHETRSAA